MNPTIRFTKTAAYVSVFVSLLLLTNCTKTTPEILDTSKEILTFSLKKVDGTAFDPAAITITKRNDSILITLPAGADPSRLIPEITIKGKTITPASGTQQDFSTPVTYTVTADDGSTRSYVVKVTATPIGQLVYFGTNDHQFYAVDAQTGALKWKYTGGGEFTYASPTYHNGVIYMGCIDSYVYAFDAATGAVIWKFKAGDTGIESDAVYANGTIYVGSNDDHLYALDASTGTLKWRFKTGSNISASPTVANGTVYFGSSDSRLYALDALTGAFKWAFATGGMINQCGPSLVNGVIYVGSRDAYLYAIDAATGTQKWKFGTGGISLEQASPTVVDGIVYFAGWYNVPGFTKKGSVYAVDANTGQLIWEALPNTGFSSSPYVANGLLYISADDMNFYALDASNGSVKWKAQILPNGASAAVSNGTVYVGGGGTRHFYAFDAATGTEKWKFPISNALTTSSPLIIEGPDKAVHSGDSGAQP